MEDRVLGFNEDVYRLASQVMSRQAHCKGNEEATKHSLILPFFSTLGYDIYDPSVLVPEYKAGFAVNKEKIDYAIFLKGQPALFVEAKAVGVNLENHDAQLAKYFNSTPGLKLAVITNGIRYKFFTDIKEPNLMDAEPFFELDLADVSHDDVVILQDFVCDRLNPSEMVSKAENLVYLRGLKRKFRAIFREPSDDFVRFMASEVYPRKITASALERLTPLVRQAMSTVLVEMVSQGLSTEMTKPEEATAVVPAADEQVPAPGDAPATESPSVVTTEEELAGFAIVYQTIADGAGEDKRVVFKDVAAYFGIQIEKPTRWFMRLHFNGKQKFVSFRLPMVEAAIHVGESLKVESWGEDCRVFIEQVDDLKSLKAPVLAAYRRMASLVAT